MRRLRALALIAVVLLTAACSGGGDGSPAGGSGGSRDGGGSGMASITAANAEQIAGLVMKSSFETVELNATGDYSTKLVLTAYNSLPAKPGRFDAPLSKALPDFDRIATFGAPIEPVALDCEDGGTFTLSGDIQTQGEITVDDELIATFTGCHEPSVSVDGSITMTVTAYSFTEPDGPEILEVLIDIDQLEVTTSDEAQTADGSITSRIEFGAGFPLATTTITITSDRLTLSRAGETETLTDFEMIGTIALEPLEIGYALAGTLASTRFTGVVDFETSQTLTQNPPLLSQGEIVITGAGGSSITISALAATNTVRIDVDTDGDGSTDVSFDRSLNALIM